MTILIGFMGAGKSTVAARLDEHFVDTDQLIKERVGMTTPAYFEKYGEGEFRKREEETLAELLAGTEFSPERVLSTGGGLIESSKNQALLSARKDVIYLQASFGTLVARIQADSLNRRSLFENSTPDEFRAVYDRRRPIYENLSDLTVETGGKTPEEIAEEIKTWTRK